MPAAASLLVFSKRGIIFQNGLFFARGGGGAACSEDPLIGNSSKGTFQYFRQPEICGDYNLQDFKEVFFWDVIIEINHI